MNVNHGSFVLPTRSYHFILAPQSKMERHASPMHRPLSLYMALIVVVLSTAHARAQQAPLPAEAADPLDICALPVNRLVFTLADLQTRNCGSDAICRSLCWCRAWATFPVTVSTLARCVPANDTSPCVGDSRDCKPVLANLNITTPAPSSVTAINSNSTNTSSSSITSKNTSSSSNITSPAVIPIASDTKAPPKEEEIISKQKHSGISTTASIFVAVACAAVLVALAFVANWYRNRPRSISAPATVSSGIQSGASMRHASSDLDTFDEKLPSSSNWRPSHRGSIGSGKPGPMHIDSNASMISGISGASYHDMDGTRLGHLDEAHALTDTELSLSKDATERVFSPLSASGGGVDPSSFLSTDSSVAVVPLGQRVGLEQYQRLQQEHLRHHNQYGGPSASSSFVSETSTTYLTNNESFMSQLTIPESDDGSTTSGPREVEF
jgi:hypothetical protein